VPTEVPTEPPPEPEQANRKNKKKKAAAQEQFTGRPGGVGKNERWIDVDLSAQTTYAYEGNTLVNSFIVSTGTWQHPTVTGTYQVYVKLRYTDMAGPGYYLADVPNTMYFYKGYGLHGTYWHENFGTPMSHGCVNLSISDSQWLFNWASVGTVVNVHE
jgi:lipoprotein-anchoring transpeptidase ErfK/SrfK